MPNPLPALLLLMTACAHAQQSIKSQGCDLPYSQPIIYENPEDSADFARFREGLKLLDPTTDPWDNDMARYQLAWEQRLHGGLHLVTRGDGDKPIGHPFVHPMAFGPFRSPFRTADGRRGVMMTNEWPCALVCSVTSYYVEE